jgi:FK506-binding protein 2
LALPFVRLTSIMRLTSALVACLLPLAAYGKACEGEDLPPDAKIRIGIKHRPEDCTQKAKNGDRLRVHYEGKLYKDCTVFDSNKKGDTSFAFVLGSRSVIKGTL